MESDHVSVPCSFGPDDCHKLTYCRKSGLLRLDEFSEDIHKLRSGRVSLAGCKRYATITKNSVRLVCGFAEDLQ